MSRYRGVFLKDGETWIRYRDKAGKLHREKHGGTPAAAHAAYTKRRNQIHEEKFFPEKIKERVILFSEVAKDWLARSSQKLRDHKHNLSRARVLVEKWGDRDVKNLTDGDIDAGLTELQQAHNWSPATFNRYRAAASGILQRALKNKKVATNQGRLTDRVKENNDRVRYFVDDERERLLKAAREIGGEKLERRIIFAADTGLRRSEMFFVPLDVPDSGLRWVFVDWKNEVITIPRSKSGEKRHVPLNPRAFEILRKIRAESVGSDLVFPGDPPDRIFPEVVAAAGMKNFRWHDLRHEFCSRLVMAGVPILTVKELAGHKRLETTLRYAHLAPRHLREAVDLLCKSITASITEKNGRIRRCKLGLLWRVPGAGLEPARIFRSRGF